MYKTDFKHLDFYISGKVRDLYDLGDFYLIVSTDRISAYDVIMNDIIPGKGKVLNGLSEYWFGKTSDIIENHLVTTDVDEFPDSCDEYKDELRGRSMIVKKAKMIPLECIVRGYLSGTAWKEYRDIGKVCGIPLPEGLKESDKLEEPIFTPSTKAELGEHDTNITHEEAAEFIGKDTFEILKEKALAIYKKACGIAEEKGIIIADTKMEFGYYKNNIIIIDELLSPDSSRFWPKDKYEPGKNQPSFDKQYLRDYLTSVGFEKRPPAPKLPEEVINKTAEKYWEVYKKFTGKDPE